MIDEDCSRCKTWGSHSGEYNYYDYRLSNSVTHCPKHCQTAHWSTTEIWGTNIQWQKQFSLRWNRPQGPCLELRGCYFPMSKNLFRYPSFICYYTWKAKGTWFSISVEQTKNNWKLSLILECAKKLRCSAQIRTVCGLVKSVLWLFNRDAIHTWKEQKLFPLVTAHYFKTWVVTGLHS